MNGLNWSEIEIKVNRYELDVSFYIILILYVDRQSKAQLTEMKIQIYSMKGSALPVSYFAKVHWSLITEFFIVVIKHT